MQGRDINASEIIEAIQNDTLVEQLLNEREKKVVDYVLDTFGIYNAWFLRDLTHLEDSWIVARGALGDDRDITTYHS